MDCNVISELCHLFSIILVLDMYLPLLLLLIKQPISIELYTLSTIIIHVFNFSC